MLILVLGNNFLLTFVGWEGVGTCSYLLISFWFTDSANASAGKKAFVTNRIGDFGFMLATFLIFGAVGTLQYEAVFAATPTIAPVTATAIVLLLFLGACGKSAQLPLYVWLPDAMAGPTPVSALIHAATMVTAGVYLMTRVNPLLAQAYDWAPDIIAWVGVITALFAATIAVAQNDIKKVLAYSTISQLGYMFLAVGTGAYVAAVFHMVTHAFFKALLFLGSGSVIHGMHGEQDMRNMGGLRKWMPVTAVTFIVGWLAIAGVLPLAGFWSKDEILAFAFDANVALWVVGLVTALLTAYYMSRQVFLVFFGEPRFEHRGRARSPPARVAVDDAVAARRARRPSHRRRRAEPAVRRGRPRLPRALAAPGARARRCVDGGASSTPLDHDPARARRRGAGRSAPVSASSCAAQVYLQRKAKADRTRDPGPRLVLRRGDHGVRRRAGRRRPSRASPPSIATVIDGAVNGIGALVQVAGATLRRTQTGYVRNYALGIAVGAVILVGLFLDAKRACDGAHRARFDLLVHDRRRAGGAAPSCSALVSRRRPEVSRQLALLFTLVTGALAVWLLLDFESGTAGFQFAEPTTRGSSRFGIGWRVGVDGISLFLVVLTGVLFPIAILGADPHHDHKPYYAWLLLLEAGCLGVFLALDLFLFFVMFEIVLVPMYFLIGGWGYGKRVYAAVKFFLFTMLGSAFMLVAILALAFLHQRGRRRRPHLRPRSIAENPGIAQDTARWLFLGFAVAFAVKVPLFPLHTWLPDAHTEAPTAGSVILAGVMLKLGTYGFLRFGALPVPRGGARTSRRCS